MSDTKKRQRKLPSSIRTIMIPPRSAIIGVMKNILLYGDSFFWGVDAATGGRHEHGDRVGTLVQKVLGSDFLVTTEGLRGRTMFGENGWFPERDGLVQFGPIFASHLPLDAVVLMLGTNDLNSKTRHKPDEISQAIDEYKEKMQFWCSFMKYDVPKIVIIAPPAVDEEGLSRFKEVFEGSAAMISDLKDSLKAYAKETGDCFLDASEIVVSQNTDGIHLDAAENEKLSAKIADVIQEILA